ncbi:MAG TPA: hypothetical protein GX747_04920 [Tenericutes bacterium]|nr:hypothetical protein [Mycoplasmatota bacterium]
MEKFIMDTYDTKTFIYNAFYGENRIINNEELNKFCYFLSEETTKIKNMSFLNKIKYENLYVFLDYNETELFFKLNSNRFVRNDNEIICLKPILEEELMKVNSRYDMNINTALFNTREVFKRYLNEYNNTNSNEKKRVKKPI